MNMRFVEVVGIFFAINFVYVIGFSRNAITSSSTQSHNVKRFVMQMSLSQRIQSGLLKKHERHEISRVLDCWKEFTNGQSVERYLDESKEIRQEADCFVAGLEAKCFHDMSRHPWAIELESYSTIILEELQDYNSKRSSSEREDWIGPRNKSRDPYAKGWKTLALQDRGCFHEENREFFPRTMKAIEDLHVPSCEIFFAKQAPKTGLTPHSDKNNFIITCHLGLDVPENECWLTVGNIKHFWKNGKSVVFDTSIVHSTENTSDRERYVLLIRFWHPDLTEKERDAFSLIFQYLDYSALGDEALDEFEQSFLSMGKDMHRVQAEALAAAVAKSSTPSKSRKLESTDRGIKPKKAKRDTSVKKGFSR